MRLLFLLIGILLLGGDCISQTISRKVISTLGGSYQDSNFAASFTVGETIITTISSGGVTANQGFQQPYCQTDSSSFADSGISTYLWNGITYTTSGSYQHTYMNRFGCDSIVTLNLTVYNTSVSMTLQNMIQISPSVFEYDVILQNTGNTALALKGYSCGLNHANGMRNGGTLTHTFISRDAALSSIPTVVPGYTASTNHLRLFTSDANPGNEVNLLPGIPIRIATMRVSNSVPFPNNFLPAINLQTVTAIGRTQCIANCIVTPPGTSYIINGVANAPMAGSLQGLTGILNTPCFYLNAVTQFSASGIESTIATCNGTGSGSAIITLSGVGATSFPGTYSIDGGASIAYTSNPFTINNLSAGTHTIQVVNGNACVSNFSLSITQNFFTPSILQHDTTICLGSSISLQAVSSASSNGVLPSNLQSGLVAWYPFNGNANDASGSGNHGIVRGPLLTTDRFGNSNSAYQFLGNDNNTISYIVANHNNLPAGNSPRTISAWLTHDTYGVPGGNGNDGHPIVSYGAAATNSDNELMFYTTSSGIPHARYAGFNNDLNVPFAYSLQTWYHMLATFDGTIASLYINDSLLASGNYSTWNTILDSLVIGTQATRTNFHNGKIDDVLIYNRVLTASEIQQLYNSDSSTYLWSTGDTTATINVSPTQTTTYYLTTTNGSHVCVDSIVVTVNQPSIDAGTAQTICLGDSVILSASGASTYQWSNSVIDAQAFFPINTATYTVVGTNSLGCTASAQVMVTVNENATPILTPTGSTIFCDGESIHLQANTGAGISYTWYKDDAVIAGATSNALTVNQSGSYIVKTTNTNTCSAFSLPQVVTVNNCNVDLQLKLFYQGYYIGTNRMTPVLQNEGVLLDSTIVDTVRIELHHPLAPFGVAFTKQAILHTDGTLTCNFPNFNGSYYLIDSYYVAITHRNGLTTWSANPISFTSPITTYDFTTSSSKAYGDNMMEMEPGIWAFFTGELNEDENIDMLDNALIESDIANYFFGYYASDLNGDGNTDLLDLPILELNIYSFIYSAQPIWFGTLPSVSTNPISSITGVSAISGGSILSDGGSPITEKGVCWSLNPNPTLNDAHTNEGTGSSGFTSNMINLNVNTTYYVRAYASNANGTVYGNTLSFTLNQ